MAQKSIIKVLNVLIVFNRMTRRIKIQMLKQYQNKSNTEKCV